MPRVLIILVAVAATVSVHGQMYGGGNNLNNTGHRGAMADVPCNSVNCGFRRIRSNMTCSGWGFWAVNDLGEECLCERTQVAPFTVVNTYGYGFKYVESDGSRVNRTIFSRLWQCTNPQADEIGNGGFGLGGGK